MILKKTKKKKIRRKKSSKTKLKEKCWNLMRNYVRLRDMKICQHCRKMITIPQDCHTSHVLSQGSYPSMVFEELNVKIMCTYCHNWWHKNPIESGDWFKEKFPERYKILLDMKNDTKRVNEEYLKNKIKFYENEIGKLS